MATQMGKITTLDEPVRTLVFDPHDASRLGLGLLLERQPWVERCLLASSQAQAVRLIRRHGPHVAVVDVSNLGPFVAPVVGALHDAHGALRVVLSSRCAAEPIAPLHQLGATGFLPPSAGAAAVLDTVRATAFFDGVPAPATASDDPLPGLTVREREVLVLLATGATNREIAGRLHVGPESVKKHATAIYRKLGVRNRTEATRRAAEVLAGA